MKNIAGIITATVIVVLIFCASKLGNAENITLFLGAIVVVSLFLSYFYFEKSNMGTKEIALISTLSAISGAARVPFAAIPNVQPTTFLVAISGYVFGPYPGFLIGSTTAFISNIFLGQGPWTPWQMFAWGLVGAISGLLGLPVKKFNKRMPVERFAIVCFLYGFMFDWIMNLWHVLGFIHPLTLKSILLAYITGLSFDIMHSAGNFIFAIIFYDGLYKVLYRFKQKLQITYIKNYMD